MAGVLRYTGVGQVALFFFAEPMTFVLEPIYIAALLLTAIGVWQITTDGEAAAFEGWALVALFAILGAFTWYA